MAARLAPEAAVALRSKCRRHCMRAAVNHQTLNADRHLDSQGSAAVAHDTPGLGRQRCRCLMRKVGRPCAPFLRDAATDTGDSWLSLDLAISTSARFARRRRSRNQAPIASRTMPARTPITMPAMAPPERPPPPLPPLGWPAAWLQAFREWMKQLVRT